MVFSQGTLSLSAELFSYCFAGLVLSSPGHMAAQRKMWEVVEDPALEAAHSKNNRPLIGAPRLKIPHGMSQPYLQN